LRLTRFTATASIAATLGTAISRPSSGAAAPRASTITIIS
jgi:hypothetical protein